MAERRVLDGRQRKSRIAVGGVATPLSIVIAYLFHRSFGTDMSMELTVALSSIIGSIVGVGSICFWDIRALILSWLKQKRRLEDRS